MDARLVVDGDRECWVRDRVETAIRMAVAISREKRVGADEDQTDCALSGLANGTAVEIIYMLGMLPSYENLRRPPKFNERVPAEVYRLRKAEVPSA